MALMQCAIIEPQ